MKANLPKNLTRNQIITIVSWLRLKKYKSRKLRLSMEEVFGIERIYKFVA